MTTSQTPRCPFETIPAEESEQINETTDLTVKLLEKRYIEQNKKILRGVHPKSHGCVKATFTINADIDSELQLLGSLAGDGVTQRFGEAADYFKEQTSTEDRMGMLDFAVDLIAADGELDQSELQLFALLGQHWSFDVENYVKTLLEKSA